MEKFITFKEFDDYVINEAKIAAEGWEAVIIYCWNLKHFNKHYIKDGAIDSKTLISDSKIDPKYGYVVNESWAIKIGSKIVENLEKNIPTSAFLIHMGTKTAPISDWWKKMGGMNNTPKTDIMSNDGKYRISLKKDGPHQFLSASADALPTIYTAFNKCLKFATPEFKSRFNDFTNDFDESSFNVWKKLDRAELLNKFKDELGIETKEELRELSKKEMTSKLKEMINKVFTNQDHKMFVKSMFDVYRLDHKLQEIIDDSEFFRSMFIGEAITGLVKFGNNDGTANEMLVFSDRDGKIHFEEVVNTKGYLEGNNIKNLIKGHDVTIHVSFKISDSREASQYSRVVINQQVDAGSFTDTFYQKEFESVMMDSYYELEDDLNEGLLDFLGILTKWFKKIILKLASKVWEWAQQGLEFLLNLAGLQIDKVDVNNEIVFSV